MKKNSISVKQVLISIITTGIFTFGLTACSDETLNNEAADGGIAPIELSSGCGLENLEQHSYAVPYMVTAKGDWKIDFEFDGRQICYAHPSEGHGPQEIKICVLDNWTDEHRTGKMTITDSENPQQPQVIQLGQKCNLDNGITRGEGGSFVTPNKGNRIYVVGYGYNMYKPLKEAVSMAPIVKVEALKDKGDFSTEGVDMDEIFTEVTGSTFHEITNNFKSKVAGKAKGYGFEGEVSAAFNRNDFSKNETEYALSTVDITKTNVELLTDKRGIIGGMMTDEAYNSINGIAVKSQTAKKNRATGKKPTYPSTDEGFYNLVKEYGTHLVMKTDMGGRLTFATTIDVSDISGNYDINAFAQLSYENSFMNASASVSDDYKKCWKENKKSVSTTVNAYGGTPETAGAVSDCKGSKASIDAWKKSLETIGNCKAINIDQETLIPIWELVNVNLEGGKQRKQLLREFIETKLTQRMEEDDQAKAYECGTIAHLGSIPTFPSAKNTAPTATLVKDVYMSGLHVARICNEFLPQLNRKERVTVIYPVVGNKVKYNLGYWIGNDKRKPCRVCCTDNDITVSELTEETVGEKKDIYMRGSSFYSMDKDSALLANEKIGETKIVDSFMEGKTWGYHGSTVKSYPIVKIFGRLWIRNFYEERVKDSKCDYRTGMYGKESDLNFNVNFWRVANYDDYQNMLDGLMEGGYTIPSTAMYNSADTEDLTGFNIEWKGWRDFSQSTTGIITGNGAQAEYLTRSADGKEFGHVRIRFGGSVEIVKNNFYDWAMALRLAVPVSTQK